MFYTYLNRGWIISKFINIKNKWLKIITIIIWYSSLLIFELYSTLWYALNPSAVYKFKEITNVKRKNINAAETFKYPTLLEIVLKSYSPGQPVLI